MLRYLIPIVNTVLKMQGTHYYLVIILEFTRVI